VIASSAAVLSVLAAGLAQAVPSPTDMSRSVAPLVDRLKPSVVTIQSTKIIRRAVQQDPFSQYLRERFGFGDAPAARPETQQSLGSGFIIDKRGIVLTNNHVVAGADEVKVRLFDDRSLDAKVEGSDPAADVAVVRIIKPPSDLRPVVLGDSEKVRVGDYVLAIGNPLGLGQTVTMGIVSAKNRALGGRLVNYEDFIQTDAAINQGNSGGPLFNFEGAVIGINSAILNPAMASNVGFAIPINLARQIGEQLLTSHRVARGYLGVGTAELTPELARTLGVPSQAGVVVNFVEIGSPAQKAGLRANDIILEVSGHRVENPTRLGFNVAAHKPGESVKLSVLRGGHRIDVDVKLSESNAGKAEVLGLHVQPVGPDEQEELGGPALKVVSVNPRGPTSGSLQEGDIIIGVVVGKRQGRATASTLQQLQDQVARGGWGRLVVLREGYQLVITVG
jgi:serine protease Do